MPIVLISALTRDRVIGDGDGLPWDLPAEYQQFLDAVRGQTIVMGRRSWQIFSDGLTTERNVVVSRSVDSLPGVDAVCRSVGEALATAAAFGHTVFVGGGASVYREALPLADQMRLSYVKGDYSGDTHFPEFDPADWRVVERRDEGDYELVRYERDRTASDPTD